MSNAMKKPNSTAILAVLTLVVGFSTSQNVAAQDAPKAKFGPQATRLFHSREYIKANVAPDFWALMPYYEPQMNPAACSLASLAMMVNGARAKHSLTASDEIVTQKGLLEKVNSEVWNNGVAQSRYGVTLDQLGVLVEQSLRAYGMTKLKVEVVHTNSASPEMKKKVIGYLRKNERNANDFIIANFLQSEFTGDPEGAVGHISPVAAYDAKAKQVLIMDVDRQYYEPYWVSEDVFLKGMATKDSSGARFRGFVYVHAE